MATRVRPKKAGSGASSAIDIVESDDVVLAEVGARLDLDQGEVDRARILQSGTSVL